MKPGCSILQKPSRSSALEEISPEEIKSAFGREDLKVFTNPAELAEELLSIEPQNLALLMMSSGNYGGFDLNDLVKKF